MKKKPIWCADIHSRLIKFWKIMRLSIFFLLLTAAQLWANDSYSQSTRLSLNMKDSKLIDVLAEIENKTEFYFLFNQKFINIDQIVNIDMKNKKIDEILSELFDNTNINYLVMNKQIVLTTAPLESETGTKPQQAGMLSGKITDQQGLPIPGATVFVKETTIGTTTSSDGTYTLNNIPSNAILVFSFIGMKTQEIQYNGQSTINLTLEEETIGLEEVIAIGYGTQKKATTTAAVAALKGEELTGAPVANVNNSLIGRVPGLLSFQNSGEPGNDAATLRIRGIGTTGNANALIVIDGIPQNSSSISHINPNEIESLTVLKDAAAVAPYGIGGANGVVLITTKRGTEGKISMRYDGSVGFQQPTVIPDFLDAYGYASALNTAYENVGSPRTFTDEELQKFKDGSDPNHYPNTDWVGEIVNFAAPITRHNVSFTGGTQKVRFYSNLGYLYQEGIVSTINYHRYNIMLNVDADVTNTTTLSLDVSGNKRNNNNPAGASGSGIFTDVTEIPPIYPLKYENGLPAHKMLPSINESGYNKTSDNAMNIKLQIEQKIPFIPGLVLKGVFGYNMGYSFSKVWSLPHIFYKLNALEEYEEQPAGPNKPTLSQSFGQSSQRTIQGYINYERSFGKHDVKFLGVYEGRKGIWDNFAASRVNYDLYMDELSMGSSDKNNFGNSGGSSKSAQLGLVFRADYSYAEKYLVQFSGRYDGHYYFAPGERFTFFPSVSLGWRISEEKFIKGKITWIDNLKIRASYGTSGNLAGSAFQYLTTYQTRTSYVFGGPSPYQVLGIYESAQANESITWETAKKGNIGFDALLFKGKIDISFDVFKEKRSDMLLSPSAVVPSEYGISLSQVNAGVMENTGFDFSVTGRKNFTGGFRANATLNVSFAKNKLIETFETAATYNNPNRRKTGRPLDTRFGLKAMGFYQVDDFDSEGNLKQGIPVPSFGPVSAGDIRYVDIAGAPDAEGNITAPDGKIDINDYTVIGNPLFPKLIFGLNVNAFWKGFDLSMLWQGASKADVYLESEMAFPFYNGAKIFEEQTDYWTPENTNASFPRLTPTPITNNNQPSSFWVKDGTYLRLKNLELGYTLPKSVIDALTIKSLRIYVSGQNLLTFSHVKFLDPELSSTRARYYFQQKVFSVGVNVSF